MHSKSCSPPSPSISAPHSCSMAPKLIKNKTTKNTLTPPYFQPLFIHLSGIRGCGVSGSTPFCPIGPTHKTLRAMSHCWSQSLWFLVHHHDWAEPSLKLLSDILLLPLAFLSQLSLESISHMIQDRPMTGSHPRAYS